MSTWISKVWRRPLAAALTFALAGCVMVGGPAPARLAVAGGSIVVAGPAGYCVDPQGSRDSARGAFVLLGSCASISGQVNAPRPRDAAVLTAAVSASNSGASIAGGQARLASYFRSADGRAALSRSGRSDTVKVLSARSSKGAFFLHLRETGVAESWRVLFDLNGRIVTLSVLSPPSKPISADTGQVLLQSFMAQVRAASPKPATATATAKVAPKS